MYNVFLLLTGMFPVLMGIIMANVSYLQQSMSSAMIRYALLISVSIAISHAVSLFNHARCHILPPLLLMVGKRGFRGKNKRLGQLPDRRRIVKFC
jgi:hypothetical protein